MYPNLVPPVNMHLNMISNTLNTHGISVVITWNFIESPCNVMVTSTISLYHSYDVLGVTLNQDTDLKPKDQFPGPKSKKMSFWSVVDN